MKSRQFKSSFFDDRYVLKLSALDKIIFIYYVWNPLVNLIGTYLDAGDEKALFAIGKGVDQEALDKFKSKVQADKKIYFLGDYVLIRNFERHDNYMNNKQMMKSAYKQFKELPDDMKLNFLRLKPKNIISQYDAMFYEELKEKDFRRLLASIDLDYCVSELITAKL